MKRINHIRIAAMVLVMVATFANADIPPAPVDLSSNTGEYWVNYTWSEDTAHPDNDNVTDSFNVSMNGIWHNGTATFLNESVGPGGWANIAVWAYNATGNGNMSVGNVSDNVPAAAGDVTVTVESHTAITSTDNAAIGAALSFKFNTTNSTGASVLHSINAPNATVCVKGVPGGVGTITGNGTFTLNSSVPTDYTSVSFVDITAASSAEISAHSDFVPNEIIVGFNGKVSKGEKASAIQGYGGTILKRNDALNSALVRVDNEQAFIKEISRAPTVKYAERNGIVHALAPKSKKRFGGSTQDYTPNDPRWNEQWGPQSIKCPNAWQTEQGSLDVLIAIVDTGIDYNHEDLTHYVTGGYDFVNDDNDPWDDHGHGTHCAGIAAATINNSIGIAGVAQAGIMAEKVLSAEGSGTDFDVAQGITHATDFGADVISMSLGGSDSSAEVANACQYAWDAGTILVAASGNDGIAPVSYPAEYDTVICVGSIGQSDLVSSFSNYGAKMELVAPGEDILSTTPDNTYSCWCGTSMATPHVAGVAALVHSHYPSWTNSDVRENLQDTAVDLGPAGWDRYYGYGKIDANAALLLVPHLSIDKSDNPDPVTPGGTLNYSIIVNNCGYAAATNVIVTETYDTNVTFDSAVPAPSSGNDTWIFPALNASETWRINISVSANPSTPLETALYSTVNVTCDQGVTDSDTEATTVFIGERNCTCGDICVITTGWWRDGNTFYPSDTPIQAAIDNAIADETICVKDGTYNENVDVNKRLTIRSENGAASTTVNALYPYDSVFEVTADYVSIAGFTVKGVNSVAVAGIYLGSSIDHCNISDNRASNNWIGIWLVGSSNNNTLTGNDASNNIQCGIMLGAGMEMPEGANNNILIDNTASGNGASGIMLGGSSNNTLTNNTANSNGVSIMQYGSSNNTANSNIAAPVLSDISLGSGIFMSYSSNNTLTSNNASNNWIGIWMVDSSNDNLLTSNNASDNYGCGILMGALPTALDTASNSTLTSNFRLMVPFSSNNAPDNYGGGIMPGNGMPEVKSTSNNTLIGNTVSGNLVGIGLLCSHNNTFSDNAVNSNCGSEVGGEVGGGIGLVCSHNNTFSDNTANSNCGNIAGCGIGLLCSHNNTFSDNTANSNCGNIAGCGILLAYSSNNTLTSNTANLNSMVGIGLVMIGIGNGADIILDCCPNNCNTLTSNNASGNGCGIWLCGTSNSTLSNNIASDNKIGIMMGVGELLGGVDNSIASNGFSQMPPVSNNNTLSDNTLSNNSDWDIYIEDSSSTFTHNTLSGTTVSFAYSGDVSLKGVGLPAAGEPGWYSIGKFITATNQGVRAWIILNFSYSDVGSDSDFTGAMDESNLTVWKYNGTWYKDGWNGTRYSDPANNTVGVNITSFSVFAPMTTGVPALDHITVEPESARLNIDDPLKPKSQIFTATGRSKHTDPIPDLRFGWSNTDTSIGWLNNSAGTVVNFMAERAGRAYLTASNGSVTSSPVQVTVNAGINNTSVTDGAATARSGDATVTCNLSGGVTGWINITAIGNATNASEVNSSKPRYGLGDGDMGVSGVTVNVSKSILDAMANGSTIRIRICYNVTTLAALGIDASTLAIWKYNITTEKWMKQPSTRSGTCVCTDVSHLCPLGLFGSKAASTPSGGSSGSGSGTYPPGWFGTPTPTVTATKGPAANATATVAPPGGKVTPAPTKMKPAATKATTPAAEGTTAGEPENGAPGFTAVFVIAGVLAVAYAMMRRRE